MTDVLRCKVMPYAWGSRTAISELQGRETPSATPEAELWMGAHPMAPSTLTRDGAERSLADVIADAPTRELGARTQAAFGDRLPFLLKVLAAAEPLSLQAHPTMAQAQAGFADEEKRGVPRDAAHRNYKDPSHKPELICALTPFDALCGFRAIDETLALFDALAVPRASEAIAPLRASRDAAGLADTFRHLMSMPDAERPPLVDAVVDACRTRPAAGFEHSCDWAVRLNELYPGDIGVVSSLLLNLVHLEPGEAIYLDAGNLHAYLDGVGVEIMASSDNVLRGGLTKKHVDVPELARVLDFSAGPVAKVRPHDEDAFEVTWPTKAREFQLSRFTLPGGQELDRAVHGPEILLSVRGGASIQREGEPAEDIPQGSAVFVPGSAGHYTLRGEAILFRATVNPR